MGGVQLVTGWTVAGLESRWRRDFSHTCRQVVGPTQPPTTLGTESISHGQSGRRVAFTTHPLFSAQGLQGLLSGELYYYLVEGVNHCTNF